MGISDGHANISYFGHFPYYKDIDEADFDYIVVTARNRGVRDDILHSLLSKGIPMKKIISFFEIFHEEKARKVFRRNKGNLDGIIIGLSHSAYGINPKYLQGNWVNLATSSEDLFYHYEVVKNVVRAQKKQIRNLKYVLIDMYDYHYFSCDTSLSSFAIPYWIFGGVPSIA